MSHALGLRSRSAEDAQDLTKRYVSRGPGRTESSVRATLYLHKSRAAQLGHDGQKGLARHGLFLAELASRNESVRCRCQLDQRMHSILSSFGQAHSTIVRLSFGILDSSVGKVVGPTDCAIPRS